MGTNNHTLSACGLPAPENQEDFRARIAQTWGYSKPAAQTKPAAQAQPVIREAEDDKDKAMALMNPLLTDLETICGLSLALIDLIKEVRPTEARLVELIYNRALERCGDVADLLGTEPYYPH